MEDLNSLAQRIMVQAQKQGSEGTEIYISRSSSLDIKVKKGEITETNSAQNIGIGIRVFKDRRQGYAYACALEAADLRRALDLALRNTAYSDVDPYLCLPEKQVYASSDLYDERLLRTDLEAKAALACETESLTAEQPYIQSVEHAGYQEAYGEVWIYNSKGIAAYEKSSYCALYCTALSASGQERDSGSGFSEALRLQALSPRACAEMTALRAGRLLGAKGMASAKCALVFDPYISCQFISLLAASFDGDNALKGKSMYASSLGQQIAPAGFALIDDSTLPEHMGSSMFDSEGVAAKKTEIITDGVLSRFLYDCRSAAQAKAVPTANAGRASFKTPPSVSTTNYYVAPGRFTAEEIIGETPYGLYVTNILGAHTANTLTGDFSLGASGILIENGKLTHPVRGVTIAGNLKELLAQIDMIGSDLTFYGAEGAPTLRVQNVQLSG